MAEVRVTLEGLEGAVRRAIRWGLANDVRFELAKTEAIIFSRNRRHGRDKTHEHVQVDSHPVPFNGKVTRWQGIYLDSPLRFTEHTARSSNLARTAERRLRSTASKHRVPPTSARHLQEAIVRSTLMYGAEVA